MSLIVDASVAVKWYVEEAGSDTAAELLLRSDLAAPSLVLAEVGSALWKRVLRGANTVAQATTSLSALHRSIADLAPLEDLYPSAMRLSVDLRRPIYDCFYIALARREAAPLISADTKMLIAALRAGVEARPL